MSARTQMLFCALLASALFSSDAPAQPQAIRLAAVVELSGTGLVAGTNFKNGVLLAVKEINAAGGVLGAKIEVAVSDTQTRPETARDLVQKAVDDGAFAVFGPVFTGSVMTSMEATRRAEVPHFIGGEGTAITQQGHPSIFRTSLTQAAAMPKLAYYVADELKVSSLAVVYVNNDFGKGGRDAITKALQPLGVKVVAEIAAEPGQKDFSAVVGQARQANPDALLVYTNEDESAGILRELRKQGWNKPVIGESTLIGQKVIELAGDAANGAVSHLGLTVDAPVPFIRTFKAAYEKEYGSTSDHNGMKGYSGVYILKAGLEKAGRLDRKALVQALHGIKIRTDRHPGVLMYTEYDNKGDLDRMSFMMKVVAGKQEVVSYLPPLSFMIASRVTPFMNGARSAPASAAAPAVDTSKKK
jgi:branched-chain amino acid transport system substrate-binding protein